MLGLPDYSSLEDIRKAYKQLALEKHPDKCATGSAEFIQVQ